VASFYRFSCHGKGKQDADGGSSCPGSVAAWAAQLRASSWTEDAPGHSCRGGGHAGRSTCLC
ncbi:hypothetical protein ACFOYZ_29375, partial [Neobacillus cucumis]|uniref:hypothetical protein n=1 Tax=Neobacillus cucumis TaxID=1740721 RepID=UPI003608C152